MTEPPSRIPPRGHNPDTKAVRDEASTKVEKVREIDPDEQAKKKFRQYYDGDASANADSEVDDRPTPFDLLSGKQSQGGKAQKPSPFSDAKDSIGAIPAYAPPSQVPSIETGKKGDGDETDTSPLPQSEDFWEEVDFPPDQPTPPRAFHEGAMKGLKKGEPQIGKAPSKEAGKKGVVLPTNVKSEKKEEPSPFGVPGKPEKKGESEKRKSPFKGPEKRPTHFEQASTEPQQLKPVEKKKESQPFMEAAPPPKTFEKEGERSVRSASLKGEKKKEESPLYREPEAVPFKPDEERQGNREQKTVEIENALLPVFPSAIQPLAVAAATQATPYIHPSTVSLFFQMVGTMYVMAGPQGINRTEIVLNNPSYARSKFYGSTIRVEKYATAPDSFNITLSGSDEAVSSFKDNIPSLMAAFQSNKELPFKINRLDVEYERPVYRRKGEEDTGGGDLGERR